VAANLVAVCIALTLGGLVAYSYASGGLMATFMSAELSAPAKLEALKQFFLQWGAWAPAAYVLFVTAEVLIAPLPGLMLYAPGGVVFGGFWGGLYSLAGNLLGAAVACQLARFLGSGRLGHKFRVSLKSIEPALDRNAVWVVFFLRINPFTSSDLVSYAAGLMRIPTWKVVLGTGLGMAPLCWLQAYLAEGVLDAFPALVYPLLIACVVYGLVALWIIRRLIISPGSAGTATCGP
jgi:uncharacterized membrane protein YdjX (TVP38/TMEM64 family)